MCFFQSSNPSCGSFLHTEQITEPHIAFKDQTHWMLPFSSACCLCIKTFLNTSALETQTQLINHLYPFSLQPFFPQKAILILQVYIHLSKTVFYFSSSNITLSLYCWPRDSFYPVLITRLFQKLLNFPTDFTDYSELEGTHKDHWVQLLSELRIEAVSLVLWAPCSDQLSIKGKQKLQNKVKIGLIIFWSK